MIKLHQAMAILFFISFEAIGQQQITGKIIDFDTKQAVKDVNVSVQGKDIKTVSNILGFFQVMADTSDYLILEKPFYETGEIKVSTNTGLKILFKKRKQAEYDGGIDELYHFLGQSIHYPSKARIDGIQGRVYTSFVIDSLGQLENIKPLKDIGDGCGDEVIRILKTLPNRWLPAETETTFILPVTFRMGESKMKVKEISLPAGVVLDEIVVTASSF